MFKRALSLLLVMAMLFTTVALPASATQSQKSGASVVLDSDGYYRYYLDGVVQTKWTVSPEGYKYYFSTSSSKYGAAMVGKNQKISSTYYDFTADGKLIESKVLYPTAKANVEFVLTEAWYTSPVKKLQKNVVTDITVESMAGNQVINLYKAHPVAAGLLGQ